MPAFLIFTPTEFSAQWEYANAGNMLPKTHIHEFPVINLLETFHVLWENDANMFHQHILLPQQCVSQCMRAFCI